MAENRLPRALHKLIAHTDLQARACEKWQDTLGLAHVRADQLTQAAANARAAEIELRAARADWAEARSARPPIDDEAWDHIRLARLSLAPYLGTRWNAGWCVAGFTRPTLRVPGQFTAREAILESLAVVLDNNPGWEMPAVNFTAARTRALLESLRGTTTRFRASRPRLRRARDTRNTAVARLNLTLRRLRKELSAVLQPTDPLWLEFDLHQPIRRRKTKTKAGVATAHAARASERGRPVRADQNHPEHADEPSALPPAQDSEAILNIGEVSCADTVMREISPRSTGLESALTASFLRQSDPLFAATDERSMATRAISTPSRGSFWNLLRAGARKITWNLF